MYIKIINKKDIPYALEKTLIGSKMKSALV